MRFGLLRRALAWIVGCTAIAPVAVKDRAQIDDQQVAGADHVGARPAALVEGSRVDNAVIA